MSASVVFCSAHTTFTDGSKARCLQLAAVDCADPDHPLCFYHQRIADQELEPCLDEAVCYDDHGLPTKVSARGVTTWSPQATG